MIDNNSSPFSLPHSLEEFNSRFFPSPSETPEFELSERLPWSIEEFNRLRLLAQTEMVEPEQSGEQQMICGDPLSSPGVNKTFDFPIVDAEPLFNDPFTDSSSFGSSVESLGSPLVEARQNQQVSVIEPLQSPIHPLSLPPSSTVAPARQKNAKDPTQRRSELSQKCQTLFRKATKLCDNRVAAQRDKTLDTKLRAFRAEAVEIYQTINMLRSKIKAVFPQPKNKQPFPQATEMRASLYSLTSRLRRLFPNIVQTKWTSK